MTPTIIALPGLGADHALFEPQRKTHGGLVVPRWPLGQDTSTIEDLARATLDALLASDRWHAGVTLLGFSFGGQVALSMAHRAVAKRLAPPASVVLLSSPRRPAQLTGAFRAQAAIGGVLPKGLIRWAARRVVAGRFAKACGLNEGQTEDLRAMARRLDADAFVRLASVATRWSFDDALERCVLDAGVRIAHLHSAKDPVIPAPPAGTHGLELLPERAHLLTWTHAERVATLLACEG